MATRTDAGTGLATRTDEVPLSDEQRGYLAHATTTGALARSALKSAALTPLVLMVVLGKLTRVLSRLPLVGFLALIYGAVATVAGGLVGVVLILPVALVLLVVNLASARGKIRADLESARAIRHQGAFHVTEDKTGGTLTCGDATFHLDKERLAGLRTHATATDDGFVFSGSLVHTRQRPLLLAAYADDGAQVLGTPE